MLGPPGRYGPGAARVGIHSGEWKPCDGSCRDNCNRSRARTIPSPPPRRTTLPSPPSLNPCRSPLAAAESASGAGASRAFWARPSSYILLALMGGSAYVLAARGPMRAEPSEVDKEVFSDKSPSVYEATWARDHTTVVRPPSDRA